MNTGNVPLKVEGIYSGQSPVTHKFRLFKVVYLTKKYACIILYDKKYNTRPIKFNLKKKPKLIPAHASGWMTAPYLLTTISGWKPQLLCKEKLTSNETAIIEGWLELCGPSIIKPS